MSAKQDRQGVRTAAQLEQKLNVSERFASIMGIATDARSAAEEAQRLIEKGLSQEEVFNILTNNGQSQGLYRGEDGELYINASYIKGGELIADLIKGGELRSLNGAMQLNLDGGVFGCTNGTSTVLTIDSGDMTLHSNKGKVFSITNALFGGMLMFWNPETGHSVGSLIGLTDGLSIDCGSIDCSAINPGKKVLFTGNVATGSTFTVPKTANYDLFAVKLGDSTNTENTVVLAYKNSNTINGVGGWAGTASLAKELFFLSATFTGDTWSLVDARKQGIYNAGSITTGTALNVKEVVGVI